MANPYLGEIRVFGFTFAPAGWFFCNGQLLSISQYNALFALLGTTYGGNGTSTFALPDLRSRVPLHFGQGSGLSSYVQGQNGGVENVTLTSGQMPAHSHLVNADGNTGSGTIGNPKGHLPGAVGSEGITIYSVTTTPAVTMNPQMIAIAGSSQPHGNIQPYLTLNFCIAFQGIFPSRA